MIKSKTKIIFHSITVAFTTLASVIEASILFNSFELEKIGTFFVIQSTSLLASAFFGFRIMEVTQLLFSNKNISCEERNNSFSELFSFYLMILLSLLPISLLIIFISQQVYVDDIFIYLPNVGDSLGFVDNFK